MKINIKSVEFKNLLSYGNKWQKFTVDNGITFISGLNLNNDRRNFTGKSNLLKMFPYSLFGKIEGLNKQRMVNWKNKKNAECIITFDKGNSEYSIHRGIKPDILEVYQNGSKIPEPPNKKDFQQWIENDILEMDYNSFMNIVYADTNNSSSILTMSKPIKRQFLEQMFNLEYYSKLKDKANKKLNIINTKISNLETTIQNNKKQVNDLTSQITKLEQELNQIPDSTKEKIRIQNQLSNLELQYKNTTSNIQSLECDKQNIKQTIKKLFEYKTKIEYKIKQISRSYILQDESYKDINKLNSNLESLQRKYENINNHIVKIDNEEVKTLQQHKEKLIQEQTQLQSKINILKDNIKQCDVKLDNKTDQDTCPTCFQNVDHELIKNTIQQERNSYEQEYNSLLPQYEETKEQLDNTKNKLTELDNQQHNNKQLQEKLDSISKQIEQIHNEVQEAETHNTKIAKSTKYKKVKVKLTNCLHSMEDKINELEKKKNTIESYIEQERETQNDYLELDRQLKNINFNIERANQERARIQSWIQQSVNSKKQLLDDNIKDEEEIKKLKSMKDYMEVIKDICKDEEVKQYTISNKVPLLNQRVNYYLNKSGVNYYVKLDNWLEPEIKGPGIRDCSFENLSGAERISLIESLRFAFSDINRLQSTTNINLLILDEIIGSNQLDSQGITNIMNIVKTKQSEDNSKVLIVSHTPNIEELEHHIDNFYQIRYDGNYSQIIKQ